MNNFKFFLLVMVLCCSVQEMNASSRKAAKASGIKKHTISRYKYIDQDDDNLIETLNIVQAIKKIVPLDTLEMLQQALDGVTTNKERSIIIKQCIEPDKIQQIMQKHQDTKLVEAVNYMYPRPWTTFEKVFYSSILTACAGAFGYYAFIDAFASSHDGK